MSPAYKPPLILYRLCRSGARCLGWLMLGMVVTLGTADGGDILRRGSPTPTTVTTTTSDGSAPATTAPALSTASDRLKVASQALADVRAMQAAARALAVAGPNNLTSTLVGPNYPKTLPPVQPTIDPSISVLTSTTGAAYGLAPAAGVPQDLTKPGAGDDATLWTGASLPKVVTQTGSGITTSTVTITQNQSQAVLNWQSFNVGKNTTLNFDQSAGGADAGQWIAFNKIGVTGNPSQILGTINAQGQVYVINPNGIIFGGSSQVNAHALVASTLPINDNLIQRGLLNNPDGQFLFSGLALAGGSNGPTSGFTPLVQDANGIMAGGSTATSMRKVTDLTSVALTYGSGATAQTLAVNDDYLTTQATPGGAVTVSLTAAGQTKVAGSKVNFAYTPAASEYGNVEVQPGAQIFSPTSADHVGGRVALIGPKVTNVGTLSSPDGQVILAAGLQVGMVAHDQANPSLRGLDVYIGQVTDANNAKDLTMGTATNASSADANGKVTMGLIETTDGVTGTNVTGTADLIERPGAVTMAGREVDQLGVVNSTTTVAFNGRIDLLANYDAFTNQDPNQTNQALNPFLYPANDSTGLVKLGAGSQTQILPSTSLTDTVNRTQDQGLALPSEINVTGQAIHLAATPATATAPAQAASILAPNGQVNIKAGSWMTEMSAGIPVNNTFLFDGGQVYLDPGTMIDVAGTQAAPASVTENVVAVQLLGSELANSPLQRNGALRGQTVKVDLRVHGPWDPTLNDGLGGYTWVGTPLADASGYVALVQRTAGELTTAGGKVSIQAGGSVVMQPGSKIDVSGGWIDYKSGLVQTTQLISGGHLYDISQATPDRVYDGIYSGSTTTTDAKWGVTQTNTHPLLSGVNETEYVQGGNGGTVSLTAASVALDGSFAGQTTSGAKQILVQPVAGSNSLMAVPSQFKLKFGAQTLDPANENLIIDYSPLTPDVTFQSGDTLAKTAPVAAFVSPLDAKWTSASYQLPIARQDLVDLSPDLVNKDGFGFVAVDTSNDNFGTNGRVLNGQPPYQRAYGVIELPVNPNDQSQPLLNFGPASALAAFLDPILQKSGADPLYSLNFTGANVDIAAGISSPGGSLSIKATDTSASLIQSVSSTGGVITTADKTRGTVTLEPSAKLGLAGAVVDYRQDSTTADAAQNIAGGQILVQGYAVNIANGSTMDVSGGVTVGTTGKVTWGDAGKVSLVSQNENAFDGATLTLPASYTSDPSASFALSGYSGAKGGEFDLTASLIQIGGKAASSGTTLLNENIFSQGGFAAFNFSGLTDAKHATTPAFLIGSADPTAKATTDPVVIAPLVQRYQADLTRSGNDVVRIFSPTDPALRSGVSLTFGAIQANGNLVVSGLPSPAGFFLGNNASIKLLPNASSQVTLKGDTVALLGAVTVPGGSIAVSGASDSKKFFDQSNAQATVYLSPNSILSTSTAGTALLTTTRDARGYTVGSILAGGKITVSGNIVAEKGALLDASGATGTLDVLPAQISGLSPTGSATQGSTLVPTTVDSDGGIIKLNGGQELFSDATLLAKAGGSSAIGGRLDLGSGSFLFDASKPANSVVPTLLLTSPAAVTGSTPPISDNVLPVSFYTQGKTAIGQTVKDTQGNVISIGGADSNGVNYFGGHVSTGSFGSGGFDWLNFSGTVEYSGAVALKAGSGITVGSGGVMVADPQKNSSLTINAPYVGLGTAFSSVANNSQAGYVGNASPVYGTGTLSVSGAKLIEVGNLSLQNIGSAALTTTDGGDLRGSGTFDVAGKLTITAGQVYPPTATTFNLAAYDPVTVVAATDTTPATTAPVLDTVTGKPLLGTITFNRAGTPAQVPLSAGGTLNLSAATISQNGVLRAPLGSIALGGVSTLDPTTGLAFPGAKTITMGASSITSVSTVDLITGLPLVEPVPYGLNLNGIAWINPLGTDITVDGPPAKNINISADTVTNTKGASIDISGGGDLYAYRWVTGTNGTKDILSSATTSYAILPDYHAGYAPYGAFSSSVAADNLQGDPGYVNNPKIASNLGDSILLDLGAGQGVQSYTLLPARYALLPGAYLVTPQSGLPVGTVKQADGSSVVSAYKYNALDSGRMLAPQFANWELAPSAVVRARAEYDDSLANIFFPAAAATHNVSVPRLPLDGGQLVLNASQEMTLQGKVNAQPELKSDGTALGLGGQVDIASQEDILITGPNTNISSIAHELVLQSDDLSTFGAASLLIGGIRSQTTTGTTVNVTADNVMVDNGPGVDANGKVILNSAGMAAKPGTALTGSDIILVANRAVEVKAGSVVQQQGTPANGAAKLILSGSVQLKPGESVGFARGGVPISFPQGTGDNSFITTVDGYTTDASGSKTTFKAGDKVSFSDGRTFTFDPTQVDPSVGATLTVSSTLSLTALPLTMVTGDGAALRVSSDPTARISRTNVSLSNLVPSGVLTGSTILPAQPGLSIDAGAFVKGGTGSVILDATNSLVLPADLSPGVASAISGQSLSFNTRGISLAFDRSAGTAGTTVLPASVLQAANTGALSLLSYTGIDVYGSGTVGGTGLQNLALHTAQITNKNGGSVTFAAVNVQLDNSAGGGQLATGSTVPAGTLAITAKDATGKTGVLQIGSTDAAAPMNLDLFSTVKLSAGSGVLLQGSGGLNAAGSDVAKNATTSLTIDAPVLAAAAGAQQTISAGGLLTLSASGAATASSPPSGLGAKLTLVGASIDASNQIVLPSGQLTLHALSGDITVDGSLDVAGQVKAFNDVVQYSGGGQINLVSDQGAVTVAKGGKLDVSAALDVTKSDGSRIGDAGSISVSTTGGSDSTKGLFVVAGTLNGQGGLITAAAAGYTAGKGGTFTLDVGQITDPVTGASLQPLDDALNAGGFNLERSIRVRSGDVLVDGTATAHTFDLSADNGSITVTSKGKIDASGDQNGTINVAGKPADAFGNVGGKINLAASGSVVLQSGADLTVAAANFDAAGKGGSVLLAAGSATNGVAPAGSARLASGFFASGTPVVDIRTGSTVDLSVAQTASLGDAQGTLHLRAPQIAGGTDVLVNPLNGTIVNPSGIVVEGSKVYDLTASGGVIDAVEPQVNADGRNFATTNAGSITAKLTAGWSLSALNAFHLQPGAEIINTANPNTPTVLSNLTPSGSTLVTPFAGGSVYFQNGSGSSQIKSSLSGTIVSASGTSTSLAANVATSIPAGSTVILAGPATISFTGIAALTNVTVAAGTTVTSGANGATIVADSGSGRLLTLKAVNSTITTTNAQTNLLFPLGTPTGDKVKFSVGGIITLADGTTSSISVNTPISLAAGSRVKLSTANGIITFASGTGGPIPVTIAAGSTVICKTVALDTSVGDLTLLSAWDLSSFRYGPNVTAAVGSGEPGVLTLRAAGNLAFDYTSYNLSTKVLTAGLLSDGFDPTQSPTNGGLWQAPLLAAGSRSWSYNLISGADVKSADFLQVAPLASLPAASGSVQLGYNAPPITTALTGTALTRTALIPQYYQTIRTGTGDVTIAAGRDVQLLNSLATIYTAGTQVANPGSLVSGNDFDVPNTYYNKAPGGTGSLQNYSPVTGVYMDYPSQYNYGGGDLTVTAQGDITHLNADGTAFSGAEMPTNWLYRRGSIDPTGQFGAVLTKDPNIGGAGVQTQIGSTSWWVDFSNFFEGVGALGGGNVSLVAGRNVSNVDAVVPTNARTTKQISTASGLDLLAAHQTLVELGGGNLNVQAAGDINAGVYYVERGQGVMAAGGSIITNATRLIPNFASSLVPDSNSWLPTTLFLGKGSFAISAVGNVMLGSVANVLLMPQGIDNSYYQRTYFSTFAPDDAVRVSSLQGDVTFKGLVSSAQNHDAGTLLGWYDQYLLNTSTTLAGKAQPWLRLTETSLPYQSFAPLTSLLPGTLKVTAFSGAINLKEDLTLSPSPSGTIDLLAATSINALQPNYGGLWQYSTINLSDADPARIPSVNSPLGYLTPTTVQTPSSPLSLLTGTAALFTESGSTETSLQDQLTLHGPRPDDVPVMASHALHGGDATPLHLYAGTGDISGLTLFSGKAAQVIAGQDITDVGLYIQNARSTDVSVVASGRDMILADANSTLRLKAQSSGSNLVPQGGLSGDIQISGPGTLEIFAGRNLDLGAASNSVIKDGTSVGIASVGYARNPYLPFAGANVVVGAGMGIATGLENSQLNAADFIAQFLNPATGGGDVARHLSELGQLMGYVIDPANPYASNPAIWTAFSKMNAQQQSLLALQIFYLVLRDAGRDHGNSTAEGFGNFNSGYEAIATLFGRRLDYTDAAGTGFIDQFLNPGTGGSEAARYLPDLGKLLGGTAETNDHIWAAFTKLSTAEQEKLALNILSVVLTDAAQLQTSKATAAEGKAETAKALAALFGGQQWRGNLALSSREIKTINGGDISLLAPGGGLSLGLTLPSSQLAAPPGILTEHGGNISIFTHDNVDVGVLRIFTLRGGNEIIWSTTGNIAAGKSSKTVQSAPPTQVLVDPQSANVKTDLAGLATGGGIGVLATVQGVRPGNVDLIAPVGSIDAGDAGIRASGNVHLAAQVVLNSTNIQAGGTTVGTPPPPPAPNVGSLTAASNSSASTSTAANNVAKANSAPNQVAELPSLITVDVIGYGGDDDAPPASGGDENEDEKKKQKNSGEGF